MFISAQSEYYIFYHNSAACLVRDGKIIAAAQEERFSRIKHNHSFAEQANEYCLHEGGISAVRLELDKEPLFIFELSI